MTMTKPTGHGRRGSALVMAAITMTVLMILVGALFMMFQMNVASYLWTEEELQAMYTAEAGANLAGYMIVGGEDVPQGKLPVQFLPDTGSLWFELPTEDLGRVRVFVDPNDLNDMVSNANSYAVRCLGRIESGDSAYTYGMETLFMPENFARFSCFQEHPITDGYYDDGYTFDGPFHANGPLCIWSSSATHENDPYFYSFNIARPPSGEPGFYYNTPGGAYNKAYAPEVGNLQMRPIERLLIGPPYFDLNVDSIPYGPDVVAWENARHAAIEGGLYFAPPPEGVGELANGTRMMLRDDTLFVKQNAFADPDTFLLGSYEQPVVWIENAGTDMVYLKGYPYGLDQEAGVNMPLTIGMNGNLCMSGPHIYANTDLLDPDNDDMLGLITVHGDFWIADDPLSGWDWPDPWTIKTDQTGGFNYYAVFMALDGQMRAQNPGMPPGSNDFYVVGGYIVYQEGITSSQDWLGNLFGFTIRCSYDTRLMTSHPPYFPQTGEWGVIYWRDWPELTEDMLDDNLI